MSDGLRRSASQLEHYREYLRLLARHHRHRQLRGKFDTSDFVQQTLFQASKKLDQFRGRTEDELKAWLRRILANSMINAGRALGSQKRNASLERSLVVDLDDTSSRLERWFEAEQSSPSDVAIRREQSLRVLDGLAQLPDDQRKALEMRYLQERSVQEICSEMNRSEASVAGLLRRGLKTLRELLRNGS